MKHLKLILWLLLACIPASAQTTVNGNVTDAGSQAWFGGTWSIRLIPLPGNPTPPQYFIGGSTTPVPNQTVSGTLDASANFTQVLYPNQQISPPNSTWQFIVCPQATSACFVQNVRIAPSTTQAVNLVPAAIAIDMRTLAVRVAAYADAEATNAQPGQFYWNVTSSISRICIASPCSGANWSNLANGSQISACSTTGGVAYQNGTNNTLTCGSGLTYAPGAGNQLTLNGPNVALSYAASDQIGSGAVYTLSAAGNASAGLTIYTGTVPGGSALIAGMAVTVAGFTNSANNGRFVVQGSTLTTITLYNGSGVAESHAATATVDLPFGITGGNAGDAQFFQFGRPGTLSTFALRGTTYQLSDYRATWPNAITYAAGVDGDSKDGLYLQIVNNGATGDHYFETGGVDDGTGASPNACRYGNQGGVEDIKCSKGGGTFYPQPQIICSGQIALSTGSITQGQRATNTLACTGISTSTDTISCTFNSDTNAVTGYAPSTSGGITLKTWISTNTINVDQVNDTGAPLTPGAATVNCKGIR